MYNKSCWITTLHNTNIMHEKMIVIKILQFPILSIRVEKGNQKKTTYETQKNIIIGTNNLIFCSLCVSQKYPCTQHVPSLFHFMSIYWMTDLTDNFRMGLVFSIETWVLLLSPTANSRENLLNLISFSMQYIISYMEM
jgi:hypothetical protein